jgi:predicted CXXCH cytochrome family protein
MSRSKILVVLSTVLIVASGVGYQLLHGSAEVASAPAANFVGSEACASCHQTEADLWHKSQHRLAMQHATDNSVLGDFSDASIDYYGVHSRFFHRDGKYLVETDGPDGKLATFEVKYTFGLDPLQQYLIEFPDGRLQALSLAWDTRPKQQGGQRWFHLYPDEEIKHDDILHWTKLNQNWNFMCAECHSTGVHKNYDARNDRFATTWSEISVGCEACHGQGSRHVTWARDQQSWWPFAKQHDRAKGLLVRIDERQSIAWRHDPSTGNPKRNFPPALVRKEVETCGRCHARRSEFSEDWIPGRWLSDTHAVSPLTRDLYYADGQMRDEVYNYGSFKQSKMFAAGVTCSDCHEPHAAQLRAPVASVCLQCHAPEKYAAASHSHHANVDPPVDCASCHMPARTYMSVDRRHDHSFRVPRPDVSAKLGTPNVCTDCHADKSPEWAATAIESWHGPNRDGFQKYGQAFHAAWSDQPNAETLLATVASDAETPAFARAGALTELAPHVSPANVNLAKNGLSDPDPMVRIGALDMLEGVPASQLWPLVSPLLADSSRGVRIKAVELLAAVPPASQPPVDREKFDRAAAEFVTAQRFNADRPESRSRLGSFYARRGLTVDAEAEYRAGLKLGPQYAPAAINLADLYRQLGRDSEGESILRAAITASSGDAGLHYALGLTLTRLKRSAEALGELRQATELDRESARYAYVYGVALHSGGHVEEALAVLKNNLVRHPDNRDILLALISYNRDAGDFRSALENAEHLARNSPGDRELLNLIEDLRRKTNDPKTQR